jgi:dephospho-CoA kinase
MPRQRQPKKKIILGITGSFGSGKSTVARIFASFGAAVIDADKLAHRCLRQQTKSYKKILAVFGRGILKKDKAIDRGKLAQAVFSNRKLLRRINRIIHPEVIRAIKARIKAAPEKLVVLDAPLLIEAGLRKLVDKLIVVRISRRKQIQRIQSRDFLGKIDILKRVRLQVPLAEKLRLADFIIDNSGTLSKTTKQAERIRRLLWKS